MIYLPSMYLSIGFIYNYGL